MATTPGTTKTKAKSKPKAKPSGARKGFRPPKQIPRADVVRTSRAVIRRKDIPIVESEDIFRIKTLGMDWDMGLRIYTPRAKARIARGADGKRVGIFLLHGGSGDFKSMEVIARLFAGKFGFKVAVMTFPGRLYLDAKSRDWPGDTANEDGTVRTPIWKKGEYVTPDQYTLVPDTSKLMKYGTRLHARAKPGSRFYDRMASWPMAFEEGMKTACARHFSEDEYSIYIHGHSTGGPYVCMLSQRVANIAGIMAVENSSFGYINEVKHLWSGGIGKIEGFKRAAQKGQKWKDRFNDLYIRTWRDLARYKGPEALGQEGPAALMRLPWLMEEILERWKTARKRPQFKAEYLITHNIRGSLIDAAKAVAKRLKMNKGEAKALRDHYLAYTRELSGPGVKPVPPTAFLITKDSRDHSPEVYHDVIIPQFKAMKPAPKLSLTRLGAGVHTYATPEKDLPLGVAPVVAKFYHDAITGGFYVTKAGGGKAKKRR
ncbi:MAG: hypothetical protein O7E53_02975 [Alphaproteobacteria bacterium]|nr:hypothetical protein [Alphaproteobacteria bacterium]